MPDCLGPVRVAGPVQGSVEPVAGAIAGEHPAGAVGAVRRRGQADDRQPCIRVAEAGDGLRPVVLPSEASGWLSGAGLAPLDQAWAAVAGMDLAGQLL
jgi:hypothetical protein